MEHLSYGKSMKKKVLVISFSHTTTTPVTDLIVQRFGADMTFDVLSPLADPIAFEDTSMLSVYNAMLILGSSDHYFDGGHMVDPAIKDHTADIVKKFTPFFTRSLMNDFPTFAFCFGHHLIAHCAGGTVKNCARTGKIGTHVVTCTPEGMYDRICSGIPKTFKAHYAHRDVISEKPHNAVVLASGTQCEFALLRYGHHVYTSQFHPEITAQLMRTLAKRYTDPQTASSVFDQHAEANHLLQNFFGLYT